MPARITGQCDERSQMPKVAQTSSNHLRMTKLRAMPGTDFAMEVARDFVLLAQPERANALRMLAALNDTINRESAAPATA